MKNLFTTIAAIFCSTVLFADPHMNASIQNVHLWRGGEVADGFVLTSELYYSDSQERLKIGFWGGMNSVGEYKEFNNCISYSFDHISLALSDTYNFSTYATYNNKEFFNYKVAQTGRFLDATIKYTLSEKCPLVLGWSTILFGRDRDPMNSYNKYSTFCSAEYPVYRRGNWRIDTSVGAAFALKNIDERANFYGDKSGIVEIAMKVSNRIRIKNYEIPIFMLTMWNPQANSAYMQLSAQVINF